MYRILVTIWRRLSGTLQWYTLWLFHAKFIIGVSAVVTDSDNRILLLKHRFWKTGSWGLPSGYAIRHETLEDAVCREVREETGLDVQVTRLVRVKSGFKLRLEATFAGQVVGGDLKIEQGEILDARFFEIDALPEGLLESHKELIAMSGLSLTRA